MTSYQLHCPPAYPRARMLLLFGLALACGCVAMQWVWVILELQPAGVDYLPLWTAARVASEHPSVIYDFSAITDLQRWLIGNAPDHPRPFIYPPSFLLLLAPFATLGFWFSYALWVAGTGALFLWSAGRSFPAFRALSLFFVATSPPFVVAVLAGQPTLLTAALVLVGLSILQTRPLGAGFLIGMAVCAKPSLLALAPLCLLAGGHYRAFAGTVIVGVTVGLLSLAVFGLDTWLRWVSALGEFQRVVSGTPVLLRSMITPTGAALELGLEGTALAAVWVVFAIAGAAIAWIGFRKPRPFEQRMTALVASGFLVSPYAMQYDAVMLVPAAITVLIRTFASSRWLLGSAALLLVICAGRAYVAPYATLGLIALLLWFYFRFESRAPREDGLGATSASPASGFGASHGR